VGPCDRGGCHDAVDGGAERAGDVDPGSFGVGGGPAGAPGQPGCPAQLTDQRLAFLICFSGSDAISGAVGGGELAIQLPDPVTIVIPGGGIQQWSGVRGGQPWATGHQVECRDVAVRGGQQGAQVVQAAAVAEPGVLGSGLQQPVFAVAPQAPLGGAATRRLSVPLIPSRSAMSSARTRQADAVSRSTGACRRSSARDAACRLSARQGRAPDRSANAMACCSDRTASSSSPSCVASSPKNSDTGPRHRPAPPNTASSPR